MPMIKGLVSIFLKLPCSLCKRPASKIICHYCEQQLKTCQLKNSCEFWRTAKRISSRSHLPVFVWGKYDGNLKRAIASMKYDRLPDLGLMLGEWLGKSWQDANLEMDSQIIAVPIPLHPKKQRQRGFNQAQKIAEGFCTITGYSLQPTILKRVKQSQAMFNLNPDQREVNINNAFAVGAISKSKQKSVLLIDDIYTTGATVREAAKVLTQKGIKVVGVATIATPSKIL